MDLKTPDQFLLEFDGTLSDVVIEFFERAYKSQREGDYLGALDVYRRLASFGLNSETSDCIKHNLSQMSMPV